LNGCKKEGGVMLKRLGFKQIFQSNTELFHSGTVAELSLQNQENSNTIPSSASTVLAILYPPLCGPLKCSFAPPYHSTDECLPGHREILPPIAPTI
jgi:hypothetical protein